MFKLKRKVRSGVQIYDKMLSHTRKTIFKLIFALAGACKVTPTKLANAYDVDKLDKYAEDFTQKLLDKGKKQAEKMKKAQEKADNKKK